MQVARASHTASALGSGATVLVAGGDDSTQALSSAEVYTTAAGTWATAASLSTARDYHDAWAIDATHVLVAGGATWTGSTWTVLSSSAIFASATGTWAAAGALGNARVFAMSTTFSGGSPVVAGGDNGTAVLNTSEVYNTTVNSWGMNPRPAHHRARERGHDLHAHQHRHGVRRRDQLQTARPSPPPRAWGLLNLYWSTGASLSTARGLAAVASYGSAPLVIGGGSTSAVRLTTTEQFNARREPR